MTNEDNLRLWFAQKPKIFTAQKMKFSNKDFFSKCDQIFNGKLHFMCSVSMGKKFI